MNRMRTTAAPIIFTSLGTTPLPLRIGSFEILGDAEEILVVAARRFGNSRSISLGSHLMAPPHLHPSKIEQKLKAALRGADLDVDGAERITSLMPLPASVTARPKPMLVATFNMALGRKQLQAIGRSLSALRADGVAIVGVGSDHPVAVSSAEQNATLALVLAAASDDDRVVDFSPDRSAISFVLVPEGSETFQTDSHFWLGAVAPSVSHELVLHLDPLSAEGEDEDNGGMKKKTTDISITTYDKKRLLALLRSLDSEQESRDDVEDLKRELERGVEVDSKEVAPDTVTMNSAVRVTDLDSQTSQTYTIVFPADADYEKGRISILSPLGTALLGYRTGDVVSWEMPRGTRRLRIEEIVYQPEAAGDYHL